MASFISAAEVSPTLRAVLISAQQLDQQLPIAKHSDFNAIVLVLDEQNGERDRAVAEKILAAGLDLYYWIEIGRHAATADAHPLWMASLQGHQEWRRLFPKTPSPQTGEVVKAYPWVPVFYRESFDEHLLRVTRLLADKPAAKGIFLNDLQGAPSACGCGNILCRWTTDYGPIRTATLLGPDAPAKFVQEVAKLAPKSECIPVWVTECEEHDRDGPCAGVGCFRGLCWKEYVQQLTPLSLQSRQLGVLLPLHDFERELPIYRQPAGWITHALSTFQTMPPRHSGKSVEANRLISVLQGWKVPETDVKVQINRSVTAGVGGYIVSRVEIDQRWEPRVVRYK